MYQNQKYFRIRFDLFICFFEDLKSQDNVVIGEPERGQTFVRHTLRSYS